MASNAAPKQKSGRSVRIATLAILLVFTGFLSLISYRIYRTWNPSATSDISDYPEMRQRLVEIYPQTPDVLLPDLPDDALVDLFYASPYGGLRSPPSLYLELVLSPAAAERELERLHQVEASRDDFSAFIDHDGVSCFEYHLGSPGSYTIYAEATFDPRTSIFMYFLGARY